uniref:Small subunit of serine palmitoyltransferase n=1 Tax=Solanum tuberosum TaxID=4113 RepID=M1B989_SOLTU
MNWVQRKIYLYNVTFGLYMLDWWERCLFNILVLVLLWFMCYNGFRFASELFNRYVFRFLLEKSLVLSVLLAIS